MQGIVGRNHVVTASKSGPNGTIDLRVEWVKLPPRPPQGRSERLRRLLQAYTKSEIGATEFSTSFVRIERDYQKGC